MKPEFLKPIETNLNSCDLYFRAADAVGVIFSCFVFYSVLLQDCNEVENNFDSHLLSLLYYSDMQGSALKSTTYCPENNLL